MRFKDGSELVLFLSTYISLLVYYCMYPPPVNEIKPPCRIVGISHLTDAIRISMYVLQHVIGCELHIGLGLHRYTDVL